VSLSYAVNGRFLTRPITGVDRFAFEVGDRWLRDYCADKAVRVLAPKRAECTPQLGPYQVQLIGRLQGHAWEQVEVPFICKDEFVLNLCNTAPVLHRSQLVVLHDAAFMEYPANYSRLFKAWYPLMFKAIIKNSRAIATVSEFSASQLMRHFHIRANAIDVIYESGEHVRRPDADLGILKRCGITDRNYVLAVGSRSANKNFQAILAAAKLLTDLNVKVVAAGGSNSRIFAGTNIEMDNLVLTGYVTDAELRALYENAQCFVFPSFYEGFGLPPLEAMECGCPVVASNRASIPEVCGNAALYFDPSDPANLAEQLRRVLSSNALRAELAAAGRQRCGEFTWKKSATTLDSLLNRANT
jgi:glycosyltransferase involved in cell wall biosynthesis